MATLARLDHGVVFDGEDVWGELAHNTCRRAQELFARLPVAPEQGDPDGV